MNNTAIRYRPDIKVVRSTILYQKLQIPIIAEPKQIAIVPKWLHRKLPTPLKWPLAKTIIPLFTQTWATMGKTTTVTRVHRRSEQLLGRARAPLNLVCTYHASKVHTSQDDLLTLFQVETNKPKILDPDDVIVKVTGSTICGSDVHLYHGQ